MLAKVSDEIKGIKTIIYSGDADSEAVETLKASGRTLISFSELEKMVLPRVQHFLLIADNRNRVPRIPSNTLLRSQMIWHVLCTPLDPLAIRRSQPFIGSAN